MFDNLPLWPTAASSHARYEDWLFLFLTVVSAAMTVLIFVVIAIFAMKYRRRHGREATPIEGSLLLEIGWSVAPLGVMMLMFAGGDVAQDTLGPAAGSILAAPCKPRSP